MNRAVSFLLSSGVTVTSLLLSSASARAADPTTACLEANNNAIDLRNDHKLRAARNQLLICTANACPADIRKECLRRVDEISALIPTIIFEAKDGSGRNLSQVKVSMDGQPLAGRLDGTALAVDPGEHGFTFVVEGQTPVTKQLVISEAQKGRRESITIGTTPGHAPQSQSGTPALSSTPRSEASSGLGTQRILALVAGGIGVVGVGVGSVFGAMTISKKSEARDACPNPLCQNQTGVDLWQKATDAGNVSTALFIVGGVGLAAGAALWLTAKTPSSGEITAHVDITPGTLQLKGMW